MQGKIDCNNINEIREERMQTQFYTGSATTHAYVQYSSNPLEISTIFVKIHLQLLNHTETTHPLCSGILTTQETLGPLINFIE